MAAPGGLGGNPELRAHNADGGPYALNGCAGAGAGLWNPAQYAGASIE